MYAETTNWPYAIFTDPSGSLFHELGMVKTLALGKRPVYMKTGLVTSTIYSIGQALRAIPQGLALKSGDQRQVGGEFLFEPLTMTRPGHAPREVSSSPLGLLERAKEDEDEDEDGQKRLTWCHRMKTTRDHAEVPELMEVLGLEGHGEPLPDQKR